VVQLVLLVEKQFTPLPILEYFIIQHHSPLTSLWLVLVVAVVVIMEVVELVEKLWLEATTHSPHHQDQLQLVLVVMDKNTIMMQVEMQDQPLHLTVFLQEVDLVVVLLLLVMARMVDLLHPQVHLVEVVEQEPPHQEQ
tara:strand:- start:32 stop:445 length:414 start_codon:yes stop_codon:yes gene_type:complete